LARSSESLADGSFVRLLLSRATPAAGAVERVVARLVQLRQGPVLSLVEKEARRDLTRNLTLPEVPTWLASVCGHHFQSALLETTRRNWQLSCPDTAPARLIGHPPRQATPPPRQHDHAKVSPLDPSACDWLTDLGFLDPQGHPFPRKTDKYRQVLRYSEILQHLLRDLAWPAGTPLTLADLGCGRGALTFAVWQLLHRQLGYPARILGLEQHPDRIAEARQIVQRRELPGIEFLAGTIADTSLPPLDILIALHACDTATDDALRRGIQAGAQLLLVAPCCQQELRPQLGRPEPLGPILNHGLFAERFAEWATDGLRALYLEWAGYRVKAIEFVASEHTPKNLLLAAIRTGASGSDPARRDAVLAVKRYLGIQHHALDPLLEELPHGT
jgi:SAM-dependent methyltransferase